MPLKCVATNRAHRVGDSACGRSIKIYRRVGKRGITNGIGSAGQRKVGDHTAVGHLYRSCVLATIGLIGDQHREKSSDTALSAGKCCRIAHHWG